MPFLQIVQTLAALAITLGLFGLGVWAMRRYGPNVVRRLQDVRAERRLAIVETLMLDPKSRLILVRVDGAEKLVLIGPGQIIEPQITESMPSSAQ